MCVRVISTLMETVCSIVPIGSARLFLTAQSSVLDDGLLHRGTWGLLTALVKEGEYVCAISIQNVFTVSIIQTTDF